MWSTIAHTLQRVVWAGNQLAHDGHLIRMHTNWGTFQGLESSLWALDRNGVRDRYAISASQRAAVVDGGQKLFSTEGV